MAGAKDAEWRPFNARPIGRAGLRPATAGRRAVRRNFAGYHAGRGGRWTAGRTRPPPGFRRRYAMAADRRHACTPGRWPRRNGAAGTVPGITAPGMVPPSMVPPDIVPPIGGTILGGKVLGGTGCGAGEWCRLRAARYVAGTGCGASYRRHGVWCRLWPARFRGGVARPQRGLAGTPRCPFMPSGKRRTVRQCRPAPPIFGGRSAAAFAAWTGATFAACCPAAIAAGHLGGSCAGRVPARRAAGIGRRQYLRAGRAAGLGAGSEGQ